MQEREWELRLTTGQRVVRAEVSGEDAARRYVDGHREAVIIAYRSYPRQGIFAPADYQHIAE